MIVGCLAGLTMLANLPGNHERPTLHQAIAAAHAPLSNAGLANLSKTITSFASTCDGNDYAIAYYIDHGTDALVGPLWIAAYDARRKHWVQRSFDYDALGSVLYTAFDGAYLYAEMHLSPSTTRTLEFTRGVRYLHEYYGWKLAEMPDRSIIYQNSMVHFANTRRARISVFEPDTGTSRQVYPMEPYPSIQSGWYREVAAAYKLCGQSWFQKHNFPMEPDWAERDLIDFASNSKTDTFAVAISYDNHGFSCDVDKPRERVAVYVYLHPEHDGQMQRREVPPPPGGVSTAALHQLLTAASIDALFQPQRRHAQARAVTIGSTLQQVLDYAKIDTVGSGLSNLHRHISDFAVTNDKGRFGIAYYVRVTDTTIEDVLWVVVFDKTTRHFRESRIDFAGFDRFKPAYIAPGSAWGMSFHGVRTYVFLDRGNVAGTTIELSGNLKIIGGFNGWEVTSLRGNVVFVDSMLSGTGIYPDSISVFSPATGTSRLIYPVQPIGRIQRAYIAAERKSYDRCKSVSDRWRLDMGVPDHLGDRSLGTDLRQRDLIVKDEHTDSIAFAIVYGSGMPPCPGATPVGSFAAYVYRHPEDPRKMEFREIPANPSLTTLDLSVMLTPPKLRKLFGDDKSPETQN
jgi:hypothetical protein